MTKMDQRKCISYADDMPSYPGPNRWCISCGHNLSSEVYVSCMICKNIDLCLPCYCKGVDAYPHFKDHPVSVITPSTQPGFEVGWTLREELIFIEALSKEYAFNWENVSNEIRTKDPEECRHHFFRCYIKAINAPDPRGGSSLSYSNSSKLHFHESNEISKINKKETIDSDTTTDSDVDQLSDPTEKVTSSPLKFPSRLSPKSSAVSSSSSLYQQQKTTDTVNSPNMPISTSSIFDDDDDDMIQFNKYFKKRKNRAANTVTNSDVCGFSLGREEFEADPYDSPEMMTLNIKFDENDTEESFMEKLEILQAYDSATKERSLCDSSLSKLKSFTDFMSQPAANSDNANANEGQNFNVSQPRRNLADRRKEISESAFRQSRMIPISKFSKIETQNFGLIEVAEDPNEIEKVSSIIHDTNSFLNESRINQNDGGTPAGTSLQAALFQHLSSISLNDEISKKEEKGEETKEIDDQSTEKEEEIVEESFKSDDNFKKEIGDDENEEKNKKKAKQKVEIEETNEDSKKEQNLLFEKKQTKKKNVSASPKKSCGSINLNVNLSEKDLRRWNDSVPLAEGAHLFDSFFYKYLGKSEIKFIKEKKISASLFLKVKSSIIPMIIGNFDKEIVLQKIRDLYPNYCIEASMITDYFYDSNLYNCVKTNGKPK